MHSRPFIVRSLPMSLCKGKRKNFFFPNHSREQRVKTWHATCWACPKIMDGETGSTEHMMCLLLVKPFLKKTWSQCLKITQKKSHFTTFEKKILIWLDLTHFDFFWLILTYSDSIWLIWTIFDKKSLNKSISIGMSQIESNWVRIRPNESKWIKLSQTESE